MTITTENKHKQIDAIRDLIDIMSLTGNETGFNNRQSNDWPIDASMTGLVMYATDDLED